MLKKNVFARKTNLASIVFKITQGSKITQAKFEKITQPTGGFGHSQPPKKCRNKKPARKREKVHLKNTSSIQHK